MQSVPQMPSRPPPATIAWSIWALGAALYFIGFYQRVAPAVITTELTQTFALSAAALGNLSAFYFYSYVAMQIPTGLLADRYGPRVLLTVGALVAAVGTAVFAMASSVWWANAGRLLIGGSVGVAFVAMLKLASHWMPARQFAMASSAALAVGVLGAVTAGAPLRLLVDAFGWRGVMWVSAAFTFVLAWSAWLWVRDDPSSRGFRSYAVPPTAGETQSIWAGLRQVLRVRNTILIFFLSGSMTGLVLTFAGLWGVPFLTTHYALTPANSAALCSLMMVAWALGTFFWSALSERLQSRRLAYMIGLGSALIGWAAMIYLRIPGTTLLAALMVLTGFCAGCFILSFAFAKESVPPHLAGTASGVANMGVIQGPMLMQPLVGVVLDRSWSGPLGVTRTFEFSAYANAFTMVLIWGAVSMALLFFTEERPKNHKSP